MTELTPDPINDESVTLAGQVRQLEREAEHLRRWKAEALPVIAGLQEIGRELALPLGARVTGPDALEAIRGLKVQITSVLAIHRPSADHGVGKDPYCIGCWEAGGTDGAPTWPCPTAWAVGARG